MINRSFPCDVSTPCSFQIFMSITPNKHNYSPPPVRCMSVFHQAGFHIQLLLSYYSVNWPLILYSLCMTLAISYSYGHKRYISELCCISNTRLQETTMTHLIVLFTTVVPVLLVVRLLYDSDFSCHKTF